MGLCAVSAVHGPVYLSGGLTFDTTGITFRLGRYYLPIRPKEPPYSLTENFCFATINPLKQNWIDSMKAAQAE